MSHILKLIVLSSFLFATVSAQSLVPPNRTPVAPTEQQKQLLKEGVALHDQDDFDGAIARYEQILKANPDNVTALYEESYSLFQKQDYKKSLEIALRAAEYQSDLIPAIYMEIGNCYDELGNSTKAIDTYKSGIKLYPRMNMLHFNLGVTYAKLGQLEDARSALKQSAMLDPSHAGTQNLLSKVFLKGNYKVPALLAGCRFLVLEPSSTRSDAILRQVQLIMKSNATRDKDANKINILIETGSSAKDEGDFESVLFFLSLMSAANLTEEHKGKTEIELLVGNFDSLFKQLAEGKPDRNHFAGKFYVPYFNEMQKKGFVEPFCYYINQKSGLNGVKEWLAANTSKVSDFLEWSRSYKWPAS